MLLTISKQTLLGMSTDLTKHSLYRFLHIVWVSFKVLLNHLQLQGATTGQSFLC